MALRLYSAMLILSFKLNSVKINKEKSKQCISYIDKIDHARCN